MRRVKIVLTILAGLWLPATSSAADLLVEAESFEQHGGWKLDTQFITEMGSPYLLAHGLGKSVGDASTTISVPEAGTWRVFVRTKDWVARWKADGQPGRFQLLINGEPLQATFGTKGAEWFWQCRMHLMTDSVISCTRSTAWWP